jgi:hypothetical protein
MKFIFILMLLQVDSALSPPIGTDHQLTVKLSKNGTVVAYATFTDNGMLIIKRKEPYYNRAWDLGFNQAEANVMRLKDGTPLFPGDVKMEEWSGWIPRTWVPGFIKFWITMGTNPELKGYERGELE